MASPLSPLGEAMTTEAIRALVERLRNCRCVESTNVEDVAAYVRENYAIRHEAAAAIEALKPLADGTHVVVGSVFLNDLRAIADTGGRRIETAMDACDKIVELIDMEARLGPAASPAPVDGERVRAAKIEAFDEALSIAEGSYSYGEQQNEIIAGIRAALAAINGEK